MTPSLPRIFAIFITGSITLGLFASSNTTLLSSNQQRAQVEHLTKLTESMLEVLRKADYKAFVSQMGDIGPETELKKFLRKAGTGYPHSAMMVAGTYVALALVFFAYECTPYYHPGEFASAIVNIAVVSGFLYAVYVLHRARYERHTLGNLSASAHLYSSPSVSGQILARTFVDVAQALKYEERKPRLRRLWCDCDPRWESEVMSRGKIAANEYRYNLGHVVHVAELHRIGASAAAALTVGAAHDRNIDEIVKRQTKKALRWVKFGGSCCSLPVGKYYNYTKGPQEVSAERDDAPVVEVREVINPPKVVVPPRPPRRLPEEVDPDGPQGMQFVEEERQYHHIEMI